MRISDWSSECALPISRAHLIAFGEQTLENQAVDLRAHVGSFASAGSPRKLAAERHGLLADGNHPHLRRAGAPLLPSSTACSKIGRASCRERVCQYVTV